MNENDKALLCKARLGDTAAKEELTSNQFSLVKDMADLLARDHSFPIDEMLKLGTAGLMKAFDRYDPENDGKFSVFAIPFIADTIIDFYAEKMQLDLSFLNDLDRYFVKSELIPAVVVDEKNNAVLMLAYVNKASLKLTLQTGYTWYYSRSRQELWNKGATSGHLQKVKRVTADCDDDTLLVVVNQIGPACHTGSYSCFFNELKLCFPEE